MYSLHLNVQSPRLPKLPPPVLLVIRVSGRGATVDERKPDAVNAADSAVELYDEAPRSLGARRAEGAGARAARALGSQQRDKAAAQVPRRTCKGVTPGFAQ